MFQIDLVGKNTTSNVHVPNDHIHNKHAILLVKEHRASASPAELAAGQRPPSRSTWPPKKLHLHLKQFSRPRLDGMHNQQHKHDPNGKFDAAHVIPF